MKTQKNKLHPGTIAISLIAIVAAFTGIICFFQY
jgi:hypothetical protein